MEVYQNSTAIIDISVLLNFENELELVTSDISFNSTTPWQF